MPRITDLPVGVPVTAANADDTILYAVQTGASRQLTVAHLAAYIQHASLQLGGATLFAPIEPTAYPFNASFSQLVVAQPNPLPNPNIVTLPNFITSQIGRIVAVTRAPGTGVVRLTSFHLINGATQHDLDTDYETGLFIAALINGGPHWVRL